MSLGTKLKKLRTDKGKSLQQVADAVGVSKAHIWEMERGTSSNPGLDLLRKLAEHFKVTVAFLADDSLADEEATSLQFFREYEGRLSDKAWHTLRTVADNLKDK